MLNKELQNTLKKIGEKLREDKELENDDPNVQQIKEAMEGPKEELFFLALVDQVFVFLFYHLVFLQ